MNTSHATATDAEDRPQVALRNLLAQELVSRSDHELQFIPVSESLDEEGVYRLTLALRYGDLRLHLDTDVIRDFARGVIRSENEVSDAATRLTIAVPLDASEDEALEIVRQYLTGAAAYRSPEAWFAMNTPQEPRHGSALAQRESMRYLAQAERAAAWSERRRLRRARMAVMLTGLGLGVAAFGAFVELISWPEGLAGSPWRMMLIGMSCALSGGFVGAVLGKLMFELPRSKLLGGDDEGAPHRSTSRSTSR